MANITRKYGKTTGKFEKNDYELFQELLESIRKSIRKYWKNY